MLALFDPISASGWLTASMAEGKLDLFGDLSSSKPNKGCGRNLFVLFFFAAVFELVFGVDRAGLGFFLAFLFLRCLKVGSFVGVLRILIECSVV